jgi:hypothetical protein
METQRVHDAALKRGAAPQALDAITARATAHFGGTDPSPAELDAFLTTLPTWDLHAMTQDAFYDMPATWRSAQWYQQHPPAERRRSPQPPAPDEVRKPWADLPLTDQMTAYRAWAAQQQGQEAR